MDPTAAYTVEVTAVGMTQGRRVSVSANSVTIRDFAVNYTANGTMILSWEFDGTEPENGWNLFYTINGEAAAEPIYAFEALIDIACPVPGDVYTFTLQSADGNTVFANTWTHTVQGELIDE